MFGLIGEWRDGEDGYFELTENNEFILSNGSKGKFYVYLIDMNTPFWRTKILCICASVMCMKEWIITNIGVERRSKYIDKLLSNKDITGKMMQRKQGRFKPPLRNRIMPNWM